MSWNPSVRRESYEDIWGISDVTKFPLIQDVEFKIDAINSDLNQIKAVITQPQINDIKIRLQDQKEELEKVTKGVERLFADKLTKISQKINEIESECDILCAKIVENKK